MSPTREPPDPGQKPLLIGAAVTLTATLVGTLVVIALLLHERGHLGLTPARPRWYLESKVERQEVEAAPFALPTDAERAALRARHRLGSYGWVDRRQAIIHVPLEVAIDHYLREHHEATP